MSDPTWGYTAETAPPRLRELYKWLEPDPNAEYGTLLPFARDKTATLPAMPAPDEYGVADVGQTMNMPPVIRPAMPSMARDFLTGGLDLLAGVETGEVTPRAAVQLGLGGMGAGGALAPRGALTAGAAKGATPANGVPLGVARFGADEMMNGLPMDLASRDARSKMQRYLPGSRPGDFLTVYHGTNKEIRPGFRLDPPERTTNAASAEAGIWASESPAVAHEYAAHAAQAGAPTGGLGPSVLPLRARAEKAGVLRLQPGMKEREILGALRDAWDAGYDAIRVTNYTMPGSLPAPDNWVFKNPNQLRSPFAAFDPAKRDSSDLLAGFAVPGPASVPGFNYSPPPDYVPGFNMQPQPDPSPGFAKPVRPVRRVGPSGRYPLAADGGA